MSSSIIEDKKDLQMVCDEESEHYNQVGKLVKTFLSRGSLNFYTLQFDDGKTQEFLAYQICSLPDPTLDTSDYEITIILKRLNKGGYVGWGGFKQAKLEIDMVINHKIEENDTRARLNERRLMTEDIIFSNKLGGKKMLVELHQDRIKELEDYKKKGQVI